jgi:Domain of unknown function (DUF6894)
MTTDASVLDVIVGQETFEDEEGLDCASPEAAQEYAARLASRLAKDDALLCWLLGACCCCTGIENTRPSVMAAGVREDSWRYGGAGQRGIQPDTLTRKAQESFRNMERRLILRHSSYHIGSRTLSSELEVFYADPERAHVGAKTIRGW